MRRLDPDPSISPGPAGAGTGIPDTSGSAPSLLRVLIVDGDPSDVTLLAAMLDHDPLGPIEYEVAPSIADALGHLAERNVDCLIADLHLPDGSGMDLVQRVGEAGADVPVILISSFNDSAAAAEAVAHGAQDCLIRNSIGVDGLSRAVRHARDRRSSQRMLDAAVGEREAALEEQALVAHRWQLVFASLREGVVLQDRHGSIVEANAAATRILGLQHDQLLGRTSLDPEWRAVRQDLTECPGPEHPASIALATGRPADATLGVPDSTGGLRWVDVHAEPVIVDDLVDGVVVTFVDVTESRARRRTLELSEHRYRSTINAISEAVLLYKVGPESGCNPVLANEAAEVLFRTDISSMVSTDVGSATFQMIDPDGFPLTSELPSSVTARTGEPVQGFDCGIVHADGEVNWIRVTSRPVFDEEGRMESVVSSATDVSAERLARRELERAHDHFATLFEHSADPIVIANRDRSLRYASPALARMLGSDPQAHAGRSLGELVHPDDQESVRRATAGFEDRPGEAVAFECRLRRADGTWCHAEVTQTNLLDDPTINGFVGNVRDITERVEIARRLAHQAMHDDLTGLPNRALLLDRLDQTVARVGRTGNACAVFFVDLDGFKVVNDSYGHGAGDQVLVAVAQRLREATRADDTVGRLGGDEFVVVIEAPGAGQTLLDTAERLRADLSRAIEVGDHTVTVGASIGIAFANGQEAETLLHQADAALYRAKELGGCRWEVFDQEGGTADPFRLAPRATANGDTSI
jgi:diguanylate cyclase (GGDEF)-like protein/PAS domain S-box-containing protein